MEKRLIKGGEKRSASPLFLPYFEAFAEKRKAKRTKEIYLATAQKIRKLLHNVQGLTLEDITLDWLEDLEDILITEGNKPSTRSIDFRNIRAVINDAKKHKLIRDYPFEGFTMPIGESSDRALTIEQLKAFIHAELKPWEEKYRDFFLLSFLLIGINTEDLLHIRTISDDGRINYVRAKTHKEMSVLVEPEALKIIEHYRGKSGFLLNVLDSYSNTHNWTSRVDKNLREMSNRIGLPEITMYWARHTRATLAHVDLGIELSTISDAFGHQPEKRVTLIYIKRKDYAKVDEANRKVIDYCFAPDDRVIK
ncbi:MAG: site-specific integrase [Bacteroidales bacterium]|nr:site-specific integrase [Bacteroidales bacterium]